MATAPDGELLAKGDNITVGYLNRDDATAEAIDGDGWFHTGDLASIDDDGYVTITGRKKDLMKTSGGKYIAPSKLEGLLKDHPLIQEAVVVADGRHFASALLAIDADEVGERDDDAVRAAVDEHLEAVNASLPSFERIKRYALIAALTVDGGFLTASLKVKRAVVVAHHQALVDALYRGEARP